MKESELKELSSKVIDIINNLITLFEQQENLKIKYTIISKDK